MYKMEFVEPAPKTHDNANQVTCIMSPNAFVLMRTCDGVAAAKYRNGSVLIYSTSTSSNSSSNSICSILLVIECVCGEVLGLRHTILRSRSSHRENDADVILSTLENSVLVQLSTTA